MLMHRDAAQPVLSVIIPFYDEVVFLPTTIKSIVAQDIKGIEVIVVNDNPDHFDQAFFDGLNLPGFVRVIHAACNSGLPSARNLGLDAARGRYIAFLDADDFYTHLGLRQMLDHAIASGADMTHGQTIQTSLNRLSGHVLEQERKTFGPDNAGTFHGNAAIKASFDAPFCWSFIYRADLISRHNLRFDPTQRKFEDRLFVIDALLAAKSIAIMGKPTHVWRRRANSITTTRPDFDARNMRIASFEKSVRKWSTFANPISRDFMLMEMMGQGFEIISRGSPSVLRGVTDDLSSDQRRELQDRYLAVIRDIAPTEREIRRHFGPDHRRFTSVKTGGMLVTRDDMVALYAAMLDRNLTLVENILSRIVQSKADAVAAQSPKPKRGNRRVIVHFGLHKTASTAIQYQLDQNKDYLATQGVLFPKAGLGARGSDTATRLHGMPGHDRLLSAITTGDLAYVDQIAAEADATGCNTIVLSVENLSAPNADQSRREAVIQQFVAAMGSLGDVTPVLFYRRPDRWFESYYRELVSTGLNTGNITPSEYLLNNERQLDFGNLVAVIEKACDKHLRLTSLEQATSNGENPVVGFMDICGLGHVADGLSLTDGPIYPSVDDQHLRLAELVNVLVPNIRDRQTILHDFYRLAPDLGTAAPIFSAAERVRIVTSFCDSARDPDLAARLDLPRDRWIEEAAKSCADTAASIPPDLLDQLIVAAYFSGIEGGEPQRLRQEIARLRRTLKEKDRSISRLRARYSAVMRSKSMRLTQPVRWAAQLFR
ncbi:glycosyltransferase family 2 protein [Loktanella sp. 3ANDIMAR09]|uniref:glycosyltransferase family 2 protein n=1 Tax=Loktanella sp. 3ANDIMAR09 TaxID=1225657 RepID=UPI000A853204|nr:glycosyltransferase family 2 protein [Loktanella sp. 3ANDIMAR09]